MTDDFEKRKQEHLIKLKEKLTINKYKNSLNYLSKMDEQEIQNYVDLSSKLFEKLKQNNYHSLEKRYPNLNVDNKKELSVFLDRDYRKINNIFKTGLSDHDIITKCDVETGIRFKLFEYVIFCESILFLFEDIIKPMLKEKHKKEYNYVVLECLFESIINDNEYKEFSYLFAPINKNLRNAIAHSDFEILNDKINYYYYDSALKQNTGSSITINDFQRLLLKISILFDVLLHQIDKPLYEEIKKVYDMKKYEKSNNKGKRKSSRKV